MHALVDMSVTSVLAFPSAIIQFMTQGVYLNNLVTLTVIYATANEADAYMFYRCFLSIFLFFSIRHKNTRRPFSGTAERIFMKLLPNDSGENVVSNVIPKWGLGPQMIFGG